MELQFKHIYETDVLVCGLGPAGITAATAAAKAGMKTMGIDKSPYAGGNISNCKMFGICGAVDNFTGRLIVGGLTRELMRRSAYLRVENDARKPLKELFEEDPNFPNHMFDPIADETYVHKVSSLRLLFEEEAVKREADNLMLEYGVQILYHTMIADVVMDGDKIDGVIIANKDGLSLVKPKMVVDCTGDADIAAKSGAPFEVAEVCQPGTLLFTIGNVKFNDYQEFYDQCKVVVAEAAKRGEIERYGGPATGRIRHNLINFNTIHIIYDATNAESVTNAEIKARKEVKQFYDILKAGIPALKDAWLQESGPCLGPRESRRIKGEYTLTEDDIMECNRFDDSIGLGCGIFDFHKAKENGHADLRFVKPHDIPYRTLLPLKVENLLVAGRCHSVTQAGLAVTRYVATAMVMGEAAGTGAALAIKQGITPRKVNTDELRSILLENGAVFND